MLPVVDVATVTWVDGLILYPVGMYSECFSVHWASSAANAYTILCNQQLAIGVPNSRDTRSTCVIYISSNKECLCIILMRISLMRKFTIFTTVLLLPYLLNHAEWVLGDAKAQRTSLRSFPHRVWQNLTGPSCAQQQWHWWVSSAIPSVVDALMVLAPASESGGSILGCHWCWCWWLYLPWMPALAVVLSTCTGREVCKLSSTKGQGLWTKSMTECIWRKHMAVNVRW